MKHWGFLFILLAAITRYSAAETLRTNINENIINFSSNESSIKDVKENSGETINQQQCAPAFADSIKDNLHLQTSKELPLKDISTDKIKKRKKLIAAILAFPFPFGIIGLHRIYLGTKPYVPLVYIGTLGGGVGIIPFIDFIVICLEKDISKYCDNPNVIMWAK